MKLAKALITPAAGEGAAAATPIAASPMPSIGRGEPQACDGSEADFFAVGSVDGIHDRDAVRCLKQPWPYLDRYATSPEVGGVLVATAPTGAGYLSLLDGRWLRQIRASRLSERGVWARMDVWLRMH